MVYPFKLFITCPRRTRGQTIQYTDPKEIWNTTEPLSLHKCIKKSIQDIKLSFDGLNYTLSAKVIILWLV